MNDRNKWINESAVNVTNKIMQDVTRFDEATLTKEQLRDHIRDTVNFSLAGAYDVGFNDGLGERPDEDEEEDSMELDLDMLRKMEDDDDDEDSEG